MTLIDTTRETTQRIYKEIDTFMKRDYYSIYRLSGAFLADFPFDDKHDYSCLHCNSWSY